MLDLLIITGSSKGIGGNIASQCNSNIAKKLITISSSGKNDHIDKDYNNLLSLKLDLTDHKTVYETVKNIILSIGKINRLGIVLCGAQIGEAGGLFKSDLEDWDKLYKCNLLGNLAIIKGCQSIIEAGAKTRIVFFGGGGAAFAYPDFSGYALSKVATVRAAENLSEELSTLNSDISIISIAPGAVATDILDKVIANGGSIRTRTDISEPTNFVYNFLNNKFDAKKLNGRFLHVRDDLEKIDFNNKDMCKLRRIS
jgi:NAD(P)-dependent dehydrogenase (short-subunit alcohol dehydrogenase family)